MYTAIKMMILLVIKDIENRVNFFVNILTDKEKISKFFNLERKLVFLILLKFGKLYSRYLKS